VEVEQLEDVEEEEDWKVRPPSKRSLNPTLLLDLFLLMLFL